MASWKSVALAVALVACAVAVSSVQLEPFASKVLGCPGAPWCPVWVKCNYTEAPGTSCHDCSTRVICTPKGGLLRPCLVPGWKNCVNGQCTRHPNAECSTGPPTEAPTEAPTETPTEAPTEVPT